MLQRWDEFIVFFYHPFFGAGGKVAKLFEPLDEVLSALAFLISLAIKPAPTVLGNNSAIRLLWCAGVMHVRDGPLVHNDV